MLRRNIKQNNLKMGAEGSGIASAVNSGIVNAAGEISIKAIQGKKYNAIKITAVSVVDRELFGHLDKRSKK